MAYNTLGEHAEIMEDNQPHGLLEPVQRAFTNLTVRRAFIVWLNRGQDTKFKDICNYYHTLEEMEELDMTPEQRARSRRLELDLFAAHNQVEQSRFIKDNYCHLYGAPLPASLIERAEAIKNETCIFKLHGFETICQKGLKTADLLAISKLVRDYCRQRNITLRKFLTIFTDHASKCKLVMTGLNVEFYVRNKLIEGELDLLNQFPLSCSFLDGPDHEDVNTITKIRWSTAERKLNKGDLDATKAELNKIMAKVLDDSVKKAFYSAPNVVMTNSRSCLTPTSSDSGKNSGEAPMEEEKDFDAKQSSDEGVGEDEDSESSTSCYTRLIPY